MPASAGAFIPPLASPAPGSGHTPRRRLTVPVLLLILGVGLVSIALIFFITLAWFVAGLQVRALIAGGITLAVIAVASMLRRRTLTMTAEGVAVIGGVLLVLDAWAIRAFNLFGAQGVQTAIYFGLGIIVIGALCRGWALLSRLRVPDVMASLALPVGVGIFVAGVSGLPAEQSGLIGLLSASAGSAIYLLPHPFSRARDDVFPETISLAAIGTLSLPLAGVWNAVSADNVGFALGISLAIVALGAGHTLALHRHRHSAMRAYSSSLGAVSAITAVAVGAALSWQLFWITSNDVFRALLAPVIAVAMAVAADRWRHRLPNPRVLWLSTWVAAALTLVFVVLNWAIEGFWAAASEWSLWHTPVTLAPFNAAALTGALGVILLVTAAPTVHKQTQFRDLAAGIVLILAAFSSGLAVLAIGVSLLVCAVALVLLARFGYRWGWLATAVVGAGTTYLLGFSVAGLWFAGVTAAVVTPVMLYRALRPRLAVLLSVLPVGMAALSAIAVPGAVRALLEISALYGQLSIDFLLSIPALWRGLAIIALILALTLQLARTTRAAVALSGLVLSALALVPFSTGRETGGFFALNHGFDTVFVLDPNNSAFSFLSWGDAVFYLLGRAYGASVTTGILTLLFLIIAFARTRITGAATAVAAVLAAPAALITAMWLGIAVGASTIAPPLAGAILAAGVSIAAAALQQRAGLPTLTRRGADAGVAIALIIAFTVTTAHTGAPSWPVLSCAAVALGAMAFTRGVAAPQALARAGVVTARFEGVPATRAPRRLLAWPSLAALTAAYLALIGQEFAPVSWTAVILLPALLSATFAAALIWLRRWTEAAIATAIATAVGLIIGSIGYQEHLPGTVTVLTVSAAVTLLVTSTRVARIGAAAVIAATLALAGMSTAILLSITGYPSTSGGLWLAQSRPWWILALIAVAFTAAAGAVRRTDAHPALLPFSRYAPVAALGVGAALIYPDTVFPDLLYFGVDFPGAVFSETTVGTIAVITVLIAFALHTATAGWDRVPLTLPVRWLALAIIVLFAPSAFKNSVLSLLESLTFPVALTLLAGAAAACLRHHRAATAWPAGETVPWLLGLALLVIPAAVAPYDDFRAWLVLLGGLVIAAAVSSSQLPHRLQQIARFSALIAAASVVLMGLHAILLGKEAVAVVAGLGVIGVAALRVPRDAAAEPAPAVWSPVLIAALAVAEFYAYTLTGLDGELLRTLSTLLVSTAAGLGGAALLRPPQWRGFGLVIAVGGALHAVTAAGARFVETRPQAPLSLQPDLWLFAGLAALTAIGLLTLSSHPSRLLGRGVGIAWSVAAPLWSLGEWSLLTGDSTDAARATITMSGYAIVATASWIWRARISPLLPLTSAAAAGCYAIGALLHQVSPIEVLTVPPALALLVLGIRRMRRTAEVRSMPALSPGIALLMVPSLLHDVGETELWRVVALGVVTVTLVIVGAVRRLKAPLVLGAAVLVVHAWAQLWPWISTVYVYVPWWLWLGIAGALLIFIAARYEHQLRAFRRAFRAVSSLR